MARTDKPAPILDLDKIESEHSDVEPFVVHAQGKPIHFKSLEELEWEIVEDLRQNFDTRRFLFEVIEDDDELNLFFEQRYKAPTLQRVMRDYYRHYGLEMPGETRLNRAGRRAQR